MGEKARFGWHKRLAERFGVGGDALYVLLAGAAATALSGLAAYALRQPLLFPSLGPTIFLAFETPMTPQASPRNTLIGHGVGIAVGFASLAAFGLVGAPSVLEAGAIPARIAAAALCVALTGAILLLLRAAHPPAGASTLIVGLGLFATPERVLAMAAGVLLLTAVAWAINRALGVPVPPWRAESEGGTGR